MVEYKNPAGSKKVIRTWSEGGMVLSVSVSDK